MSYSLGRIVPADWKHVEKYPYAAVSPGTVASVERTLDLPAYREKYDQKSEGACVGFAYQRPAHMKRYCLALHRSDLSDNILLYIFGLFPAKIKTVPKFIISSLLITSRILWPAVPRQKSALQSRPRGGC
ncbi:MAG: hypothetical protein QHH10_13005 [Peptococcaceae bacterium]|jgi:hypothetical protein|nr:hypothetical protein [Peptococcaceae bacterium]MDH7526217.1 hypothetical protein [Peptococcaceae bacterium]